MGIIAEVNDDLSADIVDGKLKLYWWYTDACRTSDALDDVVANHMFHGEEENGMQINISLSETIKWMLYDDDWREKLELLKSEFLIHMDEIDKQLKRDD